MKQLIFARWVKFTAKGDSMNLEDIDFADNINLLSHTQVYTAESCLEWIRDRRPDRGSTQARQNR